MAENIYSEQFGPELVEGSLPVVLVLSLSKEAMSNHRRACRTYL